MHEWTSTTYPKQIKKLILGQAITLPLVAAIIKIIYWGGDFFFVYLWFFVLVFTIFMMIVYPGTVTSQVLPSPFFNLIFSI